jgi:hypothetical protein
MRAHGHSISVTSLVLEALNEQRLPMIASDGRRETTRQGSGQVKLQEVNAALETLERSRPGLLWLIALTLAAAFAGVVIVVGIVLAVGVRP